MKLGINLAELYPGKIGGGEQYIRNVLAVIQRRTDIQLFLFLNSEAIGTFEQVGNTKLFIVYTDQNTDTQLNFYIDYLSLDIWFCPLFHLIPKDCTVPSVVMIFDIQQEYFPSNFNWKVLYMRKHKTAYTVKSADMLLTISQFTKSTLIEKLQADPNKIQVTWLDGDQSFRHSADAQEKLRVKKKYMLPDEYIYYPANTWPHKNHLRLLKAYYLLKKKKGFQPKLLFTGAKNNAHGKMNHFIQKSNMENDVVYLGYIEQEDMPYIYANAKILVFPSLFEGFGIPLVEAMHIGIPVVCSKSTSLPEIGEDAAYYFNGYSIKDMAEGIYTVYSDADLQRKLVDAGKLKAKMFSWDNCSEQTLQHIRHVYEEAQKNKKFPSLANEPQPLVSVVVPSYNQGQFIKETIDSIINQDYKNIECIVMDGGSADDTVDVLKAYGNRIFWVSEKDAGQADAVNKGIRAARGEIIGWLNSDDTYTEGAIQKAVDYFAKHPEADMVYGEGHYIDKESIITGRYDTEKFNRDRLAETCFICQPTAFFRKNFVDKAGGLNASLQLCMDYELWIRFSSLGRIAYIPEYLACSRMYDENKTLSRRKEVYKEVCATVKKHYGYVPFQWVFGYADFLKYGSRSWSFKILFALLFIRFNITNPLYITRFVARATYRIFAKYYARFSQNRTAQLGFMPPDTPHYGRFSDKWLSKQYDHWITQMGCGTSLKIEGRHLWPMDDALQVDVFVDGSAIGSLEIVEKGDFVRVLPLASDLQLGTHVISLVMNRVFSPAALGINTDTRDLSFILETLEVLP